MITEFISSSVDFTRELAGKIAENIQAPAVIALVGDLGAGKTEFVRGFIAGLKGDANQVSSPTFVLWQQYIAPEILINHLDLYRLNSPEEIFDIGLTDVFSAENNITLIEWAEKILPYLSEEIFQVEITHISQTERKIRLLNFPDFDFDFDI